jgi:hypothetical protein
MYLAHILKSNNIFYFYFGNQEGLSPKTKGNYKDTKHGKQIPEQSARTQSLNEMETILARVPAQARQ